MFNPLNAELNPIRHLLALVGARHIVHVSRIRVNIGYSNTDFLVVPRKIPNPQLEVSKNCRRFLQKV